MIRPIAIAATFIVCFAAWSGVFVLALYVMQRLLVEFSMPDMADVLSMALLGGGLAGLTAGLMLREAAAHWLDHPRAGAIRAGARCALGFSALVFAAGVGSALTIVVAA